MNVDTDECEISLHSTGVNELRLGNEDELRRPDTMNPAANFKMM